MPEQLVAALVAVEPPFQKFAGRTAIRIVFGQINEILLAEAAVRLGARCQRLGHIRDDAALLTGMDLPA